MQVEEREYMQHLLLSLLYARSQLLTFKGGTALRLVYQGNRYSEDLDFNGPDDCDTLRHLWQQVVTDLRDFGVSAEMRKEWESAVGYSFDVSYQGPLYDGRHRTKGKVRIDINRRQEIVESQRELINSEYDDVRPFVVTVITPMHMLAEKIRALLVRGKPRDLYDVWLLLNQGTVLDWELIDRKLMLYKMTVSAHIWENALRSVQLGWERDLRALLTQFVAYEDVLRSVERLIPPLK
jgi:predicted nucleotidyltransferase component of viral defense system